MKIIISIVLCVITSSLLGDFAAFSAERAKSTPRSPATQAFTYANIVSSFKEAHFRATEVQPRCTIFFEGEWKSANVYNYGIIIVENSDQDVQVTFYLTDAHEMNWVTEFLDSPFFSRNETESLFRMMNSHNDIRRQNVGRFRVDFHHWQPRHAQIIVFSFAPVRTQKG